MGGGVVAAQRDARQEQTHARGGIASSAFSVGVLIFTEFEPYSGSLLRGSLLLFLKF